MLEKLDIKDRKILAELDMNARQPMTILSKSVGLSRQVVEYRIKKLEQKGIITGYVGWYNSLKLGYNHCRIFLNLKNIDRTTESKLIDYLKNIEEIVWLSWNEGKWDIGISIIVKSVNKLNEIYQKIILNYSNYIEDTQISFLIKKYYLTHKYLMFDKKNVYPYYENYNDGNVFIPDEKEQLIISLIRNNAKISLLNLSKKCNIDIKTARNKLNKLYNKNIILGYRALIDTTKLGLYNYHIFFTFDNMNPKKEKRVINFIKKHPYSIEIMQSIGKPDLDCSMLFRNHFDLHMFMKEFRFLFSDIYRNHRFKMITKVYKDT